VNISEEFNALAATLRGDTAMQVDDDPLVKAIISAGYSPLQGYLTLLMDLEPVNPKHLLTAFVATLTCKSRGREERRVISSGTAMEGRLIRTQVSMDKPGQAPLHCSWEVLLSVQIGPIEERRWEKRGTFVGP
jgi:hypothetical protein